MAESLITPPLLVNPIADLGDKDNIPLTSTGIVSENDPSQDIGFPTITSQPLGDGGLPPKRTSMNGLFNLVSAHDFFKQTGGFYTFNQALSNAIGGYPVDAILSAKDASGKIRLVQSLRQNNTDNFVSNPNFIDGAVSWRFITGNDVYMPCGHIFQSLDLTLHAGEVWTDGAQYPASAFPGLVAKFNEFGVSADSRVDQNSWTGIPWVTLGAYATMMQQSALLDAFGNGSCGFIGYDATNGIIKVPTISEGTVLAQAVRNGNLFRWQQDAIRNITGHISVRESAGRIDGAFVQSNYGLSSAAGSGAYGREYLFDASRVVPTAPENRNKQIRYTFKIIVSTTQYPASDSQWAGFIDGLTSKAEVDFSNVNNTNLINLQKRFGQTPVFVSPKFNITQAGVGYRFNTGLGTIPLQQRIGLNPYLVLVCNNPVLGYSIGDTICDITSVMSSTWGARVDVVMEANGNVVVWLTDLSIYLRNKITTGWGSNTPISNWDCYIVVR